MIPALDHIVVLRLFIHSIITPCGAQYVVRSVYVCHESHNFDYVRRCLGMRITSLRVCTCVLYLLASFHGLGCRTLQSEILGAF